MIAPAYPAFNIYSRVARQTTALGPLSIATVADRTPGWHAEVIDENNYRGMGPRDAGGLPDHSTLQNIRRADVVGLYGGLSSTIPRLVKLAQFYRKTGAVTVAGGQHFTEETIPAALEAGIDYIVRGEGDFAIRELLTVIAEGGDPAGVDGISFIRDGNLVSTRERPPITEFDALPLPDFSLLRYARVRLFPVSWIRGCGMNCEFCTVKGKPRASSVERVVEQIAVLTEVHGARRFFIVDDLFGQFRRETMRLCSILADFQKAVGIRLDITVQIRLDHAGDRGMLEAMRSAGVNTVCIGYESPIPEELEAMDKRIRPDEMVKLTDLYHRAGFRVHGMFIFGYPLPAGVEVQVPTAERVRCFEKFIRRSRIDTVQILLPVTLPGTGLTRRLSLENRVFSLDHVGWEYYDGNFPLFMPDAPMAPEDMQWAIRTITSRFYRFSRLFSIGRNILIFPAMLLPLWNVRMSWSRWHRIWRNDLLRFGGWMISRQWASNFRRSPFARKLDRAKESIVGSPMKA